LTQIIVEPTLARVCAQLIRSSAQSLTYRSAGVVDQRILVVDDNPSDLMLFVEAFRMHAPDIDLETASSTTSAIARIAAAQAAGKPFTLLLIDAVWQGDSPRDVLLSIRDHATWRSMHVAVMSSGIPPDLKREYHLLGVRHFVEKPEDWSAFTAFVHVISSSMRTPGSHSPWGSLAVCIDPPPTC
jgi:CheY-like chemotaxis protein